MTFQPAQIKDDQPIENLRIFAKLLLFLLVDVFFFLFCSKAKGRKSRVIVIRSDGVLGDYFLFRNFLKEIKKSPRYRFHDIWLCATADLIDLSRTLDKDIVAGYIPVQRSELIRNIKHRLSVLRQLACLRADVVFYPSFRRDFFRGDALVRASKARERVACAPIDKQIGYSPDRGTYIENPQWLLKLGNRFYTRLLNPSPGILFEFVRNREIFSQFLGLNIALDRPAADPKQVCATKSAPDRSFALVGLGASMSLREWPVEKVEAWIELLLKNTSLDVYLVGPRENVRQAQDLFKNVARPERLKNLVGKTNLDELISFMSISTFALVNESGMAHMAAALGVPYVCISNGNHLGRFHPYPAETKVNGIYCYPFKVCQLSADEFAALSRFSALSSAQVSTEDVWHATERLISELAYDRS